MRHRGHDHRRRTIRLHPIGALLLMALSSVGCANGAGESRSDSAGLVASGGVRADSGAAPMRVSEYSLTRERLDDWRGAQRSLALERARSLRTGLSGRPLPANLALASEYDANFLRARRSSGLRVVDYDDDSDRDTDRDGDEKRSARAKGSDSDSEGGRGRENGRGKGKWKNKS